MSVQYQIVWGLLLSEIVCFLFLILPLPPKWKKHTYSYIVKHRCTRAVAQAIRIVFVLVLLLFLGIALTV